MKKAIIIIVILITISIIAVLAANNDSQDPKEAEIKPEGYIEAMFDGLQDAKDLNRKSYEDAKRNAVE